MSGPPSARAESELVLFLGGDVMLGRGIDQILEHPSDPELYEPYVKDAVHYVQLAESVSGPIPRSVSPSYVWGDLLPELDQRSVDVRIVNLETAVTRSHDPWHEREAIGDGDGDPSRLCSAERLPSGGRAPSRDGAVVRRSDYWRGGHVVALQRLLGRAIGEARTGRG